MQSLARLAKMLGVPTRLAEDALHSERAARAVLSRRNLFAAGAAMAAGSLLVGGPLPLYLFHSGDDWIAAHSWADYRDRLQDWMSFDDGDLEHALSASYICKPTSNLTICWDPVTDEATDERGHSKTLAVAEWLRREGPGYLCSVHY
jgi:hypothetical protein